MKDKQNPIQWINCAKAAAILAVLTDHTMDILYTNYKIQWASFYAVSLFIIVSGITSYMSNMYSTLNWGKAYFKSIKKIIMAYLISSAICLVIKTQGFDVIVYLNQIVHFNASLPLYFVSLYLQLMFVSRGLFWILQYCPQNKNGYILEGLLFFIISFVSAITTNYTQILDIYAGGGKVLGGTYLILFYLGMLMAKHNCFNRDNFKKSILIWGSSSVAWIWWWNNLYFIRKVVDYKIPFGAGYEIPSVAIIVFSIITLFSIYGACKMLEKIRLFEKVIQIGAWFGEHTLYIFMCHNTILHFYIIPYWNIENMWLKRIVYFGLMILIPIIIEYIVKLCTTKMKRVVEWMRKEIFINNII